MIDGRSSGNQQDIGRVLQQPGKCNLHRRDLECSGRSIEYQRLQRREASQWEEWNISDTLRTELVDEGIVVPVGNVVEILYAHDFCNAPALGELLGTYIAQTNVANESLTLKFCEHRKRFRNRSLGRLRKSANPKINGSEGLEAEISQVVVNAVDKLLGRKRGNPGLVCTPTRSQLSDNYETVRIRMQCPLNKLVGH